MDLMFVAVAVLALVGLATVVLLVSDLVRKED